MPRPAGDSISYPKGISFIEQDCSLRSHLVNSVLYYSLLLAGFALPLSKSLATIAFALMAVVGLYKLLRSQPRYVPAGFLLFTLALWWGHKFLGLLWTDDFALAKDDLKNVWYFFSVPTLAYYLKKESLTAVLWAYALGTVFAVTQCYLIAAGILQSKGQAGYEPYFHIDYSILIAIGLICIVWLRCKVAPTGIWARVLEIALIAVTLNLFGFQNGRTGQMSCIVALFCLPLFIFAKKQPKKAVVMCIVSVLVMGMLFKTIPFFQQRWSSVSSEIERGIDQKDYLTSQGGRIGMWVTAYEIVSNNPLLGTGTGDTEKELAITAHTMHPPKVATRLIKLAHFHNGYVQSLVQLGFPGLFSLLCMLGALVHVQKKCPQQAWLWAITLLLLVAMMTEPFILKARGRMAFALLMGVSLVLARKENEGRDPLT